MLPEMCPLKGTARYFLLLSESAVQYEFDLQEPREAAEIFNSKNIQAEHGVHGHHSFIELPC